MYEGQWKFELKDKKNILLGFQLKYIEKIPKTRMTAEHTVALQNGFAFVNTRNYY